jgi:predicted DNA-binding transcriptional regulator YafY
VAHQHTATLAARRGFGPQAKLICRDAFRGTQNSADVHDVAVRIFPPQARVAHEYPLTSTQHIEPDGDAVIVHAKVSGLEEVTRWVLRWGGDAQVLAPQALQDRLRTELARMTAHLSAHP